MGLFPFLPFFCLKFINSEKAKKICEISTNYLSLCSTASQIIGGDFAKFCGLLRIYELYILIQSDTFQTQNVYRIMKQRFDEKKVR